MSKDSLYIAGVATYVVATQAGFNKIVKRHFHDSCDFDSVCDRHEGYPKAYPSVVTLSTRYHGGGNTLVFTCTPLSKRKIELQFDLARLCEIDDLINTAVDD